MRRKLDLQRGRKRDNQKVPGRNMAPRLGVNCAVGILTVSVLLVQSCSPGGAELGRKPSGQRACLRWHVLEVRGPEVPAQEPEAVCLETTLSSGSQGETMGRSECPPPWQRTL